MNSNDYSIMKAILCKIIFNYKSNYNHFHLSLSFLMKNDNIQEHNINDEKDDFFIQKKKYSRKAKTYVCETLYDN